MIGSRALAIFDVSSPYRRPDHGTPADSAAIRRVSDELMPARDSGETVAVHCSAGIGRTGTFVAIDIMRMRLRRLAEAEAHGGTVPAVGLVAAVAVRELVQELRQERLGLVHTM